MKYYLNIFYLNYYFRIWLLINLINFSFIIVVVYPLMLVIIIMLFYLLIFLFELCCCYKYFVVTFIVVKNLVEWIGHLNLFKVLMVLGLIDRELVGVKEVFEFLSSVLVTFLHSTEIKFISSLSRMCIIQYEFYFKLDFIMKLFILEYS
jgi:hypothetical protein